MKRPTALTIVAWLFIASGALALIGVAIDLFGHGKISIDFTVLNWWIGRWLLDLRQRGYRWAVTMLRIEFVVLPLASLVVAVSGLPLDVRVFGYLAGHASRPVFVAFATALLVLATWQYLVLRQAARRGLFVEDDSHSGVSAPAA